MNYSIDSTTIMIACGLGMFPGAVIAWLARSYIAKRRELRISNETWRQATTFYTHKDNKQATRL